VKQIDNQAIIGQSLADNSNKANISVALIAMVRELAVTLIILSAVVTNML
jgi:hypothetical protein